MRRSIPSFSLRFASRGAGVRLLLSRRVNTTRTGNLSLNQPVGCAENDERKDRLGQKPQRTVQVQIFGPRLYIRTFPLLIFTIFKPFQVVCDELAVLGMRLMRCEVRHYECGAREPVQAENTDAVFRLQVI